MSADIKNAATWWKALDTEWDDLYEILAHHMDMGHPAHEKPGRGSTPRTGRDISRELAWLRIHRDPKIARYLFGAWNLASEAYARSRPPGWSTLCDLLSEEWAVQPDAPDYDEVNAGVVVQPIDRWCAVEDCIAAPTCCGAYEGSPVRELRCDTHCGHGGEDGKCSPIAIGAHSCEHCETAAGVPAHTIPQFCTSCGERMLLPERQRATVEQEWTCDKCRCAK